MNPRCPYDGQPLKITGEEAKCPKGHRFSVERQFGTEPVACSLGPINFGILPEWACTTAKIGIALAVLGVVIFIFKAFK